MTTRMKPGKVLQLFLVFAMSAAVVATAGSVSALASDENQQQNNQQQRQECPDNQNQNENFMSWAEFEPEHPDVGENTSVTVKFQNKTNRDITGPVIDLEIYDESNNRVFQEFTQTGNRVWEAGGTGMLTYHWTPEQEGHYVARIGLFTSNWQQLLHWNNCAGEVHVGDDQQNGQGQVDLVGRRVQPGQGVLAASFMTEDPPSKCVLLDLELYNEQGQKVAQEFFNDVVLSNTDPIEKEMAIPEDLPNGEYTFKTGIFGCDWQFLIHWHDPVGVFSIGDAEEPNGEEPNGEENGMVVMTRAGARPTSIDVGETADVCAQFGSPDADSTVLINLELYDAGGEKVAQEFWDDQFFAMGGADVYCITTSPDLPAGEYTLDTGVFSTGWSGLINWYDDAAMLTIVDAD